MFKKILYSTKYNHKGLEICSSAENIETENIVKMVIIMVSKKLQKVIYYWCRIKKINIYN